MKYNGKGEGEMGMKNHDYQPGEAQFAGKVMGKANDYMSRTDKRMVSDAKKVKNQAYKGRYE